MGSIPFIHSIKSLRFKDSIFSKKFWLADITIIGYIALINLVLHLIAIRGYGYFRDEFYYIACSNHPSFGYVDQPPLAMLLLKFIRLLFEDSLIAIRILPVLSGAFFVFFTGLIARELGGKKFALVLASTAAFAPIGNFFLFNIYSMNFLDLLFWQACIFLVIRIIKTNNPKYWLLFGLIADSGCRIKYLFYSSFSVFPQGSSLRKKKNILKANIYGLAWPLPGCCSFPT